MRKLHILLLLSLPLLSVAQTRYCTTYKHFLNNQWQTPTAEVSLVSSTKQDALALTVKSSDKESAYVLKRSFLLEKDDSLYINLRSFNTFGDVYVRTWQVGEGRFLFARQQMPPRSFKSISKLENLVCYEAVWDARRDELRLVAVTPELVLRLLQDKPEAQQRYMSVEKKRRTAADVIISALRSADVIK